MTNTVQRIEQARQWLLELERDKQALEERLEPLLMERAKLDQQESIVRSLLASLRGEPATPISPEASSVSVSPSGGVKEYVESHTILILEAAGEPMHINDIHAKFRERGYTIPGAGKPVNITSHIRESERIKSPERGIYGLIEKVGDFPVRTRMKSKRRR